MNEYLVLFLLKLFSISWLTILPYSFQNVLNWSVHLFGRSFQSLGRFASAFSPQACSTAKAADVDVGRAIKIDKVKQFHFHLLFMFSRNHRTQGLRHGELIIMRLREAFVDVFSFRIAHKVIGFSSLVGVSSDIERVMRLKFR
jgi:hypothetical protein